MAYLVHGERAGAEKSKVTRRDSETESQGLPMEPELLLVGWAAIDGIYARGGHCDSHAFEEHFGSHVPDILKWESLETGR